MLTHTTCYSYTAGRHEPAEDVKDTRVYVCRRRRQTRRGDGRDDRAYRHRASAMQRSYELGGGGTRRTLKKSVSQSPQERAVLACVFDGTFEA